MNVLIKIRKSMKLFFIRHLETLLVSVVGLIIFSSLNWMMTQWHYERWTNPKVGFWSIFHKGFELSGFDQKTYIVVSKWRPLYEHFRHPLLEIFVSPLSWLNGILMDEYRLNFAIILVAIVWTLVSTGCFTLMYKLQRNIIGNGVGVSLLLTQWLFSFAFVMLATFAPDHMILTMFLLLLTLYLSGKALQRGGRMKLWHSLLLFFLATGVTTTNCAKVWLIDVITAWKKKSDFMPMFRRSLVYLLPVAVICCIYFWQQETLDKEFKEKDDKAAMKHVAQDKKFAQKIEKRNAMKQERENKQIADSKLFEYTDNTIPLLPSLKDNIFGEGFQLHEDYLLKDSNELGRPTFVKYNAWWKDAIEALLVLLFAAGVWAGRKERFLWVAMSAFFFDMFLHVVLRFALKDVYIMTAHWAFVIPIAVGYLLRNIKAKRGIYDGVIILIGAMTMWLWWYNGTLILGYLT